MFSQNIFIILNAIATMIIAIWAIKSHLLAKQINKGFEKEKNKYKELIAALIASNITVSHIHGQSPESNLNQFKDQNEKVKKYLNL